MTKKSFNKRIIARDIGMAHKCDACGRIFTSMRALKLHALKSHGVANATTVNRGNYALTTETGKSVFLNHTELDNMKLKRV